MRQRKAVAHALAMVLAMAALTARTSAAASPESGYIQRPQAYCADGRQQAMGPAGRLAGAFARIPPAREGGLCTAIFLVRGTGEAAGSFVRPSQWSMRLEGEALARPGAVFVMLEGTDAQGRVVAMRLPAFTRSSGAAGEALATLVMPGQADMAAVRMMVSARDGLALVVDHIHVAPAAPVPPSAEAMQVFSVFETRALVSLSPTEWDAARRAYAVYAPTADDDAAGTAWRANALRTYLKLAHTRAFDPNESGVGEALGAGRSPVLRAPSADCPEPMRPRRAGAGGTTLLIEVPAFMAPAACAIPYAEVSSRNLAAALAAAPAVSRVVVDLRGNSGGNMWPMLGGLAPLLPGTPLIGLRTAARLGEPVRWVARTSDGVGIDGVTTIAVAPPPPSGNAWQVPIEGWICGRTASSGEAVAIALRSAGGRLVGRPSSGLATSNVGVSLPHGVQLMLTTADMLGADGTEGRTLLPAETRPDAFCTPGSLADAWLD